jgi:hypothetical protein
MPVVRDSRKENRVVGALVNQIGQAVAIHVGQMRPS